MTTAIPETPEQLEEALHDDAMMSNIFAEGNFGKFTQAYIGAWSKRSAEDVRQFKEKMQAEYADFVRDQAERNGAAPSGDWGSWKPGMGSVPAGGRGARRARAIAKSKIRDAAEVFDRQGLFSPSAVGAHEDINNDDYTASLTKFIWAALKGESIARQDGNAELLDRLQRFKGGLAKTLEVRNATTMSERIPSEGGFLVPENLRSEILSLVLEDGVMRKGSTVIPMDSLRVPLPIVDDTSHTSSVFGGVAAYWTAEGAALTASAPSFGRLVLIASKLTAYTQIPNELLQDSASPMDVWFNTFFPQAVSFFEDLAFLTGDGVDQPEGVLNCPGAVTVTDNSSASVTFGDIASMMSRLWPPSLKRAMWVCSPDTLESLLQLAVAPGGTAIAPPGWLNNMQMTGEPGGSEGDGYNYKLMGLPLRVSEKVPYQTNGAGSLALIDPSYYLIGDRQAMQVASSAEYAFANDMMSYRVIERLDGRGWFRTPLTPANGSTDTLSPFVLLSLTGS